MEGVGGLSPTTSQHELAEGKQGSGFCIPVSTAPVLERGEKGICTVLDEEGKHFNPLP